MSKKMFWLLCLLAAPIIATANSSTLLWQSIANRIGIGLIGGMGTANYNYEMTMNWPEHQRLTNRKTSNRSL